MTRTQPPTSETVRAWVDAFAEGWRAPSDPESFAEHFIPWFDPDIRLSAPLMPTTIGIQAFRERFVRPLFIQFPDVRGSVLGWAASGPVIYIELLLQATVGRRRLEWPSVDRITMREDKIVERVANFDPTVIAWAVARTPSVWPRFVRARIAAGRR